MLSGCPQYLIDKLQRVQNNAARLVLRAQKTDHVTPLLHSLHWLPISSCINYKISCLSFTSLFNSGPTYLSKLLKIYTPNRALRFSKDTRTLILPSFRTKSFGYRCFSYQGPLHFNSLPSQVRHSKSVNSFKASLKTYLFRTYYK